MAPSYPPLPNSPMSIAHSARPDDDLSKHKIVRSASGTGIFSSLFTICLLIFFNELRYLLYNYQVLYVDVFDNFMFSFGFIISTLQLFSVTCVLFVPTYLLVGNKMAKLSPLILAIILQLLMLSFNGADLSVRTFAIQSTFDKLTIVRNILMTYGAFFASCTVFVGLNSAYDSNMNKIFRPFEYEVNESPV